MAEMLAKGIYQRPAHEKTEKTGKPEAVPEKVTAD